MAEIRELVLTFLERLSHHALPKNRKRETLDACIDDKSSSRSNSKSSRMPLKLEKRRFIFLLVVGDISHKVILNSSIDFKLKYLTRQVFSLL